MQVFTNLNGKIYLEKEIVLSPNNRSFRYGDGFFETIKIKDERILLSKLHFQRISNSLEVLKFQLPKFFSIHKIFDEIVHLSQKNKHQNLARIRLTFFRGNGGLYDAENHYPNYIIQSYALSETLTQLNSNGLVIDFYNSGIKTIDNFCNLKTNSFLPYTMAAIWAKENKLNDAIILNSNNFISDTTIANLFIVKNGKVITPGLNDACIAGVTRAFLLHHFDTIEQQSISKQDILHADEVFLTNAIRGIQWVKQVGESAFNLGAKTIEIYNYLQAVQNN